MSDFCNPMDCSLSGSSVGFSRQEYWSGLPFPFLGDLPDPGIKPRSPTLQAESLPTELQGKSQTKRKKKKKADLIHTHKSLIQIGNKVGPKQADSKLF